MTDVQTPCGYWLVVRRLPESRPTRSVSVCFEIDNRIVGDLLDDALLNRLRNDLHDFNGLFMNLRRRLCCGVRCALDCFHGVVPEGLS